MGKVGGRLEAVGGVSYHFCGFLQSGGTGGVPVQGRDIGLVSVHVEAGSGGPQGLFSAGDGEMGEEATWWYIYTVRGVERYGRGRDPGHTDIT